MTTSLTRINTQGASLPATYSAARTALEQCVAVDECKSWADKALALKSYAKQAQDDELHKMAARIQGRAMRRVGDLLREIERPPQGGRPPKNGDGGGTVSRASAASDAGLSTRQKVTALRVAAVPESEFEAQIESDDPPTVTELARQGTKGKSREEMIDYMTKRMRERPEYQMMLEAGGRISDLAALCRRMDPAKAAHGFEPGECKKVRDNVEAIRQWMGPFLENLED